MLYVVRHGETASNAARVIQTPETPLSDRGAEQARRVARRLAGAGIVHILASDLARARETAEALQSATGATLELEPLLQERNFGALRGTPYAELGLDPFAPGYTPPQGESWDAFHVRVEAAWSRLVAAAAERDGHLAVVTHGLVCFSLATRHLTLPAEADPGQGFGNTSLTIVEGASGSVRLYNCTAHLEEDGVPGLVV